MKKFLAILLLLAPGTLLALTSTVPLEYHLAPFQLYKSVGVVNITVPTVVELPLAGDTLARETFALLDVTGKFFAAHDYREVQNETPVSVTASNSENVSYLADKRVATYASFELPGDRQGETTIFVTAEKPITTSALSLVLDDFVALPWSIEILAHNPDPTIVFARARLSGTTLYFPKTASSKWEIRLTYVQPLRISELALHEERATVSRSLRFLAEPNHQYELYLNPDRSVTVPTKEGGDFSSGSIKKLAAVASIANPLYTPSDSDTDSIPDRTDNCVSVANSAQEDQDENGRGDACDDFDRDGVINDLDNCRDTPNRGQADIDGDNVGDSCDGEESRITERLPWLPWVGMGVAALVILGLFATTLRPVARKGEGDPTEPPGAPPGA